jgi:endonuclease G, mitochondrial
MNIFYNKARKSAAIYSILFFLLISFSVTLSQTQIPKSKKKSIHVSLGVPTDSDPNDDYLIFRNQYALSYNCYRNTANWVSWELNKKWFGKYARYNGRFISDSTLPADCYHVTHSDYTNSGYDRGHMVRSEERTNSANNNKSTFLLSNILPQRPDLNQGVWLNLEYYCQKLCKEQNKELFIIAGGVFHNDNRIDEIVAIPDSCFKIIVVLDKGQTIKNINVNTTIIAVVMPNIQGIRNDKWDKYKTTIRRIENSTGYNFLSNLKQELQDKLELRE